MVSLHGGAVIRQKKSQFYVKIRALTELNGFLFYGSQFNPNAQ